MNIKQNRNDRSWGQKVHGDRYVTGTISWLVENVVLCKTRMHSSRMRTALSLPYGEGGPLCPGEGLCLQGGSLSRGGRSLSRGGGLCPGGLCLEISLTDPPTPCEQRQVSVQGRGSPGGFSAQGVSVWEISLTDPPTPCEQNHRHV